MSQNSLKIQQFSSNMEQEDIEFGSQISDNAQSSEQEYAYPFYSCMLDSEQAKKINRLNEISKIQQQLQQIAIEDFRIISQLKKLIEVIFSDRYLNEQKNVQVSNRIQQSRKGYIQFSELLLNQQISKFFHKFKINQHQQQLKYIKKSAHTSGKLKQNKNAVRRLLKFQRAEKYLVPILIQGFPAQMDKQIVLKVIINALNLCQTQIRKINRKNQIYIVYISQQQTNENQSFTYTQMKSKFWQIEKEYRIEYQGINLVLETQRYDQFLQVYNSLKEVENSFYKEIYQNSLFSKYQKMNKMLKTHQNFRTYPVDFKYIERQKFNKQKQFQIPKPLSNQQFSKFAIEFSIISKYLEKEK